MTEEEAREWLRAQSVPRETFDRLSEFVRFLLMEAEGQNLIAASSFDTLWARHIVDSAQLLLHVPRGSGSWLDIGSGAGFPGLVIGALSGHAVTLVEPRQKRAAFLKRGAELLGIQSTAEIVQQKLEAMTSRSFSVISARAVAPLPRLLPLAHRFSSLDTIWLLPKGRSADKELESVASSWHGDFTKVPSLTDPSASIVVATKVRPGKLR